MPDTPLPFPLAETRRYRSFDGGTSVETRCFAPDRYRFFDPSVGGIGISRGAGLSYSPASFSRSIPSLEHRYFNRMLDFDGPANILEVEAGVTLGQIYRFAAPRGLFLPVQPGHTRITVGGCIGADVHGKNQFRDGTFLNVVESLRLFHPSHGILELSRTSNPGIFFLTCGGYGLTGNILTARLRLAPVPSSRIVLKTLMIGSIGEFSGELAQAAAQNDIVYSWHDFTVHGKTFGRGVIVAGRFDGNGSPTGLVLEEDRASSLDSATRGLRFPFFNRLTTPLVNRLYYASYRLQPTERSISLYEFLFPVRKKEMYFHLFGRRGFHECQIIVAARKFTSFVERIRERLESHPLAVALASGKLFQGHRELLRFTGDGICLALNFPRNQAGAEFAAFLDELMIEHNGWSNLIKDSRLSARVVDATYPECEQFRQRLRGFDPHRLYRSELSERLRL